VKQTMLYEFKDIADVKALPARLSELCWHITGFVDGDGSFPVVLSPIPDKKFGWLVQPRFEVELRNNSDSLTTLKLIQRVIGLRTTILQAEGFVKLNVTNRRLLLEKVIPFFCRYRPALKQSEFRLFKQVTELLEAKKHLEESGFKQIVREVFSLPANTEQRRKWTFKDVLPEEQEPPRRDQAEPVFPEGAELRHYLAGFIDAEGALGFAVIPETRTITPYVTLTHSDVRVLRRAQQVLQAGAISAGRLQVYGVDGIKTKVVPFLEKHRLITKRTAYLRFKEILELVAEGEHKKRFDEIASMVRSMNDRGILRDHTLGAHPEMESEDMAQHRKSVA
jgi:hypothetical protein